jgi:hypothetical protein
MSVKEVTTCMGYQQITSLSSAAGMTIPVLGPNGLNVMPTFAYIVPEAQAVRWRDDGTAPTASVGWPLAVGQPLKYDGDLRKIQFIEQTSGAKLNISYYA